MIHNILNSLRHTVSNDDIDSRRTSERRELDNCIGMIDGKMYPVKNWSNGGISLTGDDREFSINDIKEITMKFKLSNRVIDVRHTGKILRKDNDQVVIQFTPLTDRVSYRFKQIVDDYITQEFMMSQQ